MSARPLQAFALRQTWPAPPPWTLQSRGWPPRPMTTGLSGRTSRRAKSPPATSRRTTPPRHPARPRRGRPCTMGACCAGGRIPPHSWTPRSGALYTPSRGATGRHPRMGSCCAGGRIPPHGWTPRTTAAAQAFAHRLQLQPASRCGGPRQQRRCGRFCGSGTPGSGRPGAPRPSSACILASSSVLGSAAARCRAGSMQSAWWTNAWRAGCRRRLPSKCRPACAGCALCRAGQRRRLSRCTSKAAVCSW
mmetsp:Transcript_76068/g.240585  ORF Transcript_76068/g.240585 Transcript_76068/m.240585 type:complete len:248 (-) Transcript_76068:315-1058(-)